MDEFTLFVKVAKSEKFAAHFNMREAVDPLGVRAAFFGFDCELVKVSSTSARQEEAGGVIGELKMLQIMVVAGEIKMNVVLAEKWLPIPNEDGVVTVDAIRVDGVMAHDGEEGSGEGLR